MKLPQTREEYTVFALEYANRRFYTETISQLQREDPGWGNENFRKAKRDIEQWILDTLEQFPDLVRVDYVPEFHGVQVYIANVIIRTFNINGDLPTQLLHSIEQGTT